MKKQTKRVVKKIFLHLGMTKTGTTSIQNTAKKYANLLLDNGIYYPYFTLNDSNHRQASKALKKTFKHGGPLQSIFSEKPSKIFFNRRHGLKDVNKRNEAWNDQLDKILNSDHDVCLIGEHISLLSKAEMRKCLIDLTLSNAK